MGATGAQGVGHVRHPDAAVLLGVPVAQRHLLPLTAAGQIHPHRTVEAVGVGHRQCALGAVDLDGRELGGPHVEGRRDRPDGTVGELEDGGGVCGALDVDDLPVLGLAGDPPLQEGGLGHSGHTVDRSDEVHQRRQIVRPHVEQWPASGLVVELGVRMPVLVAVAHHVGAGGDRLADEPIVDDLATRLDPPTEEGVRGAADQEPPGFGQGQHPLAVLSVHGEGLLAVGGLARLQSGQRHLGVRVGDGEVDRDLNLRVGKELLDAARPGHPEVGRLGLCPLGHHVGAGDDIEDLEPLPRAKVRSADVPTSDDADLGLHHCRVSLPCVMAPCRLRRAVAGCPAGAMYDGHGWNPWAMVPRPPGALHWQGRRQRRAVCGSEPRAGTGAGGPPPAQPRLAPLGTTHTGLDQAISPSLRVTRT